MLHCLAQLRVFFRALHTLSAKSGSGGLQSTHQLQQGDLGLVGCSGCTTTSPWASLDTADQGTEPNSPVTALFLSNTES